MNELLKYLNSLHELINSTNEYTAKRQAVLIFNDFIFDHDDITENVEISEKVYKFAMESEYYEPDPKVRKEDPNFFGDQQLLNKLELLQIEVFNSDKNNK